MRTALSFQAKKRIDGRTRRINATVMAALETANMANRPSQLPSGITHYNEAHLHKALEYRSPHEFIRP